jgi:hypothetical protein
MVILGRVHNGVVVLEGESALPEGAVVTGTQEHFYLKGRITPVSQSPPRSRW